VNALRKVFHSDDHDGQLNHHGTALACRYTRIGDIHQAGVINQPALTLPNREAWLKQPAG
jgi:hypothetical protein